MSKTYHFYVSGRVQGVFFRMRTQEQAQLFGLTGWVKNLPDGRVEVMASGQVDRLKELQDWLGKGPDLARVLRVDTNVVDYMEFEGFTIRY